MPDPMLFLTAMSAAALTAAAMLLICGWPWRTPRPGWVSLGGVLGAGLGFYVGCGWLGVRPHWPPQEDQDRLLLLLIPAFLVVEVAAALLEHWRWLGWSLRLVLAAGAARILLHNTTYLTELAGPGSREWTTTQIWLILGGLALSLAGAWVALSWLAAPGRSVPLAVALTCAGAAVTIMLSGYASGGQMGLPLAAAVAGATLATLFLTGRPVPQGVLGLGIVGLFALLVVGRFFGQLPTGNAALLFLAPLLGWLSEGPYLRRLRPGNRGLLRVVFTLLPLALVLVLAHQQFAANSVPPSAGSKEPTLQDYMDFGK